MLPECCNLRPDARGQLCLERSLTSAAGGRARAVCRLGSRLRLEVAGGKGFFVKEGSFLPVSQQTVQTPAKGWGLKQHQLLLLLQNPRTTLVWDTRAHQEGSGDAKPRAALPSVPLPTQPLLRMPPMYLHRPASPASPIRASPIRSSSIPSDPRPHPGGFWE